MKNIKEFIIEVAYSILELIVDTLLLIEEVFEAGGVPLLTYLCIRYCIETVYICWVFLVMFTLEYPVPGCLLWAAVGISIGTAAACLYLFLEKIVQRLWKRIKGWFKKK